MKELRERLTIALDEFIKSAVDRQGDGAGNLPTVEDWLNKWTACLLGGVPIPMLLYCPKCNTQHVDAPAPDRGWENPPHRSHYCEAIVDGVACAHHWRPSDYYTTGVVKLDTVGMTDGFTQPGGQVTTVLQPTEVVELVKGSGVKKAAGKIALNIGARLILGKTKPGQWVQKNFGDTLTTFERQR